MTRPSSNGYHVTQLTVFDPAGQLTYQSEFAQTPTQGTTPGAEFVYNDAGWLVTSSDPLGHDVDYTYDARGNRRTRTSTPDGSTAAVEEWTYDAGDRLTSEIDPLDQTTTYTWGTTSGAGYGRVATVADPSGRTAAFTYDLAGRVTGESNTAQGLDTVTQTWGYDDLGRRISATRQVGSGGVESQSFSFDLAGNLLVQDGPEVDAGEGYDPDRVTHSWSVTGTPRRMTYPNGAVLQWDHDDADRVRFTYLISGGVTLPIGEYSYYSSGLMRKEHFDGGQIAQRWYHYQNNSDELTYYEQNFASPNDDADIDTDLVYDDAGRLVSECDLDAPASSTKTTVCTSSNGTLTEYGYDPAGQLTDVEVDGILTDEVTYDWVGNRDTYTRYDPGSGDPETLDTYTTEADGALDVIDRELWGGTSWGTAADLVDYTFDAAGRRTGADHAGGETWNYTWDAQGRMVGRDSTDNTEDEIYGYDPAGNLDTRTSGGLTGHQVWDNSEPVSRLITLTGLGTLNWGYGIRPLYLSGFGVWMSHDHHGSVVDYNNIGLPDDYDAWGNPQGGDPNILNGTLPFYRSEFGLAGLTHLRNRDYDPTTGTFLTPDPMMMGHDSPELTNQPLPGHDGTPTVANPYHYVYNDPLNFTDPLGLWPWDGKCIDNPWDENNGCESVAEQHSGFSQGVADFSGGLFDGIFVGQGREIFLNPTGLDDRVNWNSNWVTAGQWTGYAIDAWILAEVGLTTLATSETWMFSSGFLRGGTILAGAPTFLATGYVGFYVFAQLFGQEKREGQRLGDAGLRYLNPQLNPGGQMDGQPPLLPYQWYFPGQQQPVPGPMVPQNPLPPPPPFRR